MSDNPFNPLNKAMRIVVIRHTLITLFSSAGLALCFWGTDGTVGSAAVGAGTGMLGGVVYSIIKF